MHAPGPGPAYRLTQPAMVIRRAVVKAYPKASGAIECRWNPEPHAACLVVILHDDKVDCALITLHPARGTWVEDDFGVVTCPAWAAHPQAGGRAA